MSTFLGPRALVLNANYMPVSLFPIHTIPVEDAITRVFNGTCHVVFEYERAILTPSLKMKWPSVIARNTGVRVKEKVKLRRESLYYRDHGICVYCEKKLTINQLTYDHVYPRAKGGAHAWDNIVSSCGKCNNAKGHSMPVGNWKPKIAPFEPTYFDLLKARRKWPITIPHASWETFLGNWEAEVLILRS